MLRVPKFTFVTGIPIFNMIFSFNCFATIDEKFCCVRGFSLTRCNTKNLNPIILSSTLK